MVGLLVISKHRFYCKVRNDLLNFLWLLMLFSLTADVFNYWQSQHAVISEWLMWFCKAIITSWGLDRFPIQALCYCNIYDTKVVMTWWVVATNWKILPPWIEEYGCYYTKRELIATVIISIVWQRIRSSLVQVMCYHLFGAKSLL